jgi:hypothetical protein
MRRGFRIPALTKDDMNLLAQTYEPELLSKLSSDASARKDFARQIREVLAIAQEALNKGVDRRPVVQRQFELSQEHVVSFYYFQQEGKKPEDISDQEIDAFFKEPGNQEKFDRLSNDDKFRSGLSDINSFRRYVATSFIGARKGRALGIHEKPNVKLEMMLGQAIVLNSEYSAEDLLPLTKATEAEIDAYLSEHPDQATDLKDSKASRDRARQAVEVEKMAKLRDEIVSRSSVVVPDDFPVSAPSNPSPRN